MVNWLAIIVYIPKKLEKEAAKRVQQEKKLIGKSMQLTYPALKMMGGRR